MSDWKQWIKDTSVYDDLTDAIIEYGDKAHKLGNPEESVEMNEALAKVEALIIDLVEMVYVHGVPMQPVIRE